MQAESVEGKIRMKSANKSPSEICGKPFVSLTRIRLYTNRLEQTTFTLHLQQRQSCSEAREPQKTATMIPTRHEYYYGPAPMSFILSWLILSSVPYFLLLTYCRKVWRANEDKRSAVLKELGIPRGEKKTLVGFFHPYWCVASFLGVRCRAPEHRIKQCGWRRRSRTLDRCSLSSTYGTRCCMCRVYG